MLLLLWRQKVLGWKSWYSEEPAMDEKSLYAHILNLPAPLQVQSLTVDKNLEQ
ncbi:UNVERIFIED_ORG: hypothetical protein M2402_004257 [Rahnella aquatilis]